MICVSPREYWKRPPDVSGLSDEELVTLARQFREEGFRGIVRRYEPAVKERIYDLVRDHDLTDDLTQTTWDKAFALLHTHDPDRKFSAWLLRIAYNTTIDHLRRKRPDTLPLHNTFFEITPPNGRYRMPAAPILGRMVSREHRLSARDRALKQALRQLSRDQRRCIILRFSDTRSFEDIARRLGLPVGTVKTHVRRGLEKLRTIFDPMAASLLSDSAPSDPFYSPA